MCLLAVQLLQCRSSLGTDFNPSIAIHSFAMCMLTSLSLDEVLLPEYVNLSINLRGLPLRYGIGSFLFKTLILCFVSIHVEANASCYLPLDTQQGFDLDGVLARSPRLSGLSASISFLKIYVIAQLGFELAYFEDPFQYFNHYTTETIHWCILNRKIKNICD